MESLLSQIELHKAATAEREADLEREKGLSRELEQKLEKLLTEHYQMKTKAQQMLV